MTQPRFVLPGQTLLITRRTVSRHYLFRPDSELNRAFQYCLALAAQETGVVLHAAVLMSTHYHVVLTDTRGIHPLFTRRLNRLFANFTKVHRAWSGEVFNAAGPSVVSLQTADAILDKIAYTLANPVAAGAVSQSSDWPGVRTRIEALDSHPTVVRRPKRYFREQGSLPAEVKLGYQLPESLRSLGVGAVAATVKQHEKAARHEVRARGWSYLGARRARNITPYRRATAYEAFGSRNPTFATKGSGGTGYWDAVAQLRAFRRAYREAVETWRQGVREAVFPEGTWWMRLFHGVRCVSSSVGT